MNPIIEINNLSKTYANGHRALKSVNLKVNKGEILALLGPNGAGKTTLISIICGITSPSTGSVAVGGYDIIKDYRTTRRMIGLVPQELTLGTFDLVGNTVSFSRGLFGQSPNPKYIDQLLTDLALLDKKHDEIRMLSGGMKRRVLIAKALSHQPQVLFLDEPTAGVDVELRKDMWAIVKKLQASGVTIILTTHYIEEAEAIADRVGVINQGELLLVQNKTALMAQLGKKQLVIELREPVEVVPDSLRDDSLTLSEDKYRITYTYSLNSERTGITDLLQKVRKAGLNLKDLNTSQSSLEEIFVKLVKQQT